MYTVSMIDSDGDHEKYIMIKNKVDGTYDLYWKYRRPGSTIGWYNKRLKSSCYSFSEAVETLKEFEESAISKEFAKVSSDTPRRERWENRIRCAFDTKRKKQRNHWSKFAQTLTKN